MTIRTYVKRQRRNYVIAWVVLLVALAAVKTVLDRFGIHAKELLSIGPLIVMAGVAWAMYHIPCLNCGRPLGLLAFTLAGGRLDMTSPRCPHCNLSVDAELPAG